MWHISKEAAVDGTATTDHVDPHIQKLAMSDPEPGESGCGFVQTAQGLIELFTRVVEAQESTQLADEPTSMPIGWYVVRHVRVPFRSESVAGLGGRTSVGRSILRSAPGRFSPVDDDASTEHGTRRAFWRGSTRNQGSARRGRHNAFTGHPTPERLERKGRSAKPHEGRSSRRSTRSCAIGGLDGMRSGWSWTPRWCDGVKSPPPCDLDDPECG